MKEDLIKLRYVNHDKSMPNASDIKRRFKRYNFEDQAILDTISIQFNSFFLDCYGIDMANLEGLVEGNWAPSK